MDTPGEKLIGVYCPECGCASLDVVDRHIVCTCVTCPRHSAAEEILAQADEMDHVVTFTDDSFSIQHPLHERLDDKIADCNLHSSLLRLGRPPIPNGRYYARDFGDRWAVISEDDIHNMQDRASLMEDLPDRLREMLEHLIKRESGEG